MAPLPLPRPSSGGIGGFFDDLIDDVTGTFDRVVDLGLGALELKIAQEFISNDLASNQNFGGDQTVPVVSTSSPSGLSLGGSLNDLLPVIAIGGGLALIVVLLVKK